MRDFVCALIFNNFLTHDKYIFVSAHFLSHRISQCFSHCDVRHLRTGSNFRLWFYRYDRINRPTLRHTCERASGLVFHRRR